MKNIVLQRKNVTSSAMSETLSRQNLTERCFDTLDDAKRDFDKVCPKAPGAAFLGALFIFLVGVLFLKLAAGLT